MIHTLRKKNPLIHVMTNKVVANFTANGLLALGASPIMAKEYEEMTDIGSIADGILLNIGTSKKADIEAYLLAGKAGNKREIPVVLDPVGVSASKFRSAFIEQLLEEVQCTAMKGNAGEIAFLAGESWETKGVDSAGGHVEQLTEIAQTVADKYDTIVIISGETDIIATKNDVSLNGKGHSYLRKVTGAGCLLGAVVTAFLSLNTQDRIGAFEATRYYGLSAERAAAHPTVRGPGTFLPVFIDELGKGESDE